MTRLAEALSKAGDSADHRVFAAAGLLRISPARRGRWCRTRCRRASRGAPRGVGLPQAARIADQAGRLTADYLLANRIPGLAQRTLGLLPPTLALGLLLRAIGRHSWTFAGRGRFGWRREGETFILTLAGGPVSRDVEAEAPVCAYYAATFERIFAVILRRPVLVVETACQATGAAACEFTVFLR